MELFSSYRPHDIPRLIAVAVMYYLISKITNQYFLSVGISIPIIRLQIGFALGIVLLYGYGYWPAIFIGSLASRLVLDYSLLSSCMIAGGVSLGVIFGKWLVTWHDMFDITIPSFNQFFRLIFWAGIAGVSVSALSGVFALVEQGITDPLSFLDNFCRWWMGDTLGILLLTPLLLIWHSPPRNWMFNGKWILIIAYLCVSFLAGQVIFLDWFHDIFGKFALGYWMFLFVVWGGTQFGSHAVVLVLLMTMIQALAGASNGVGFFGQDLARSQLLNVWFYLFCLSMVGTGVASTGAAFKIAEEGIRKLAHHDPLTGLANRLLLTDRLQQALVIAKREERRLALIFHDLDNFKPVNDRLGHRIGDLLLIEVANRIRHCVRESDTASRIGGDEFVIILPTINSIQDVLTVANKIHYALLQPFDIECNSISISTSIGIAIYPEHGSNDSDLLINADNAMYFSKTSGRNTIEIYSPETPKAFRG